MGKNILFIGSSGKLSHFMPAKDAGYKIILLKEMPTESDKKYFDGFLRVNPFDVDSVLKELVGVKIDAVLTRFEPYVPLVGLLCDKFGLVGPSLQGALNARDKLFMREALKKAGVPQPKFVRVESVSDMKKAGKKLGYPFLIKPISGAKSRFILKVNSPSEIDSCFKIVSDGCKKSGGNLFLNFKGIDCNDFRKVFLAEELIVGKQVTTTSFVNNGDVVHVDMADLVTGQDVGVAFYLISRTTPSLLGDDEKKEVYDVSTRAIKALGLDNTPLHPEFIITKDGPKVLEVAARIGGYRTDMTNLAFGVKLNEIAIKIALGEGFVVEKKFEKGSTAVEVWPKKSGMIKEYRNLDVVRDMDGVVDFVLKKEVGKKYFVPPKGEKPVATFYTVGKDSKKIADEVLDKFEVIID